jgi:glucose-6-phosphate isomerase
MLRIHYEHCISDHELSLYEHKLQAEIKAMQEASKEFYEDDRASINLPVDKEDLRMAKTMAARFRSVSLVVVIGIGGSNLGTVAVQEAILGKLHNLNPGKRPRIVYSDTVDSDSMAAINALVQAEIKRGKKVLLNAVSKSGSTTESIANFEVLLQSHKRMKDSKKHVVITTNEDSPFWRLAKQEGYAVLPMPKKVGGRYSVMSAVGLFPLAVVGVDIERLLDGAAQMRIQCLKPGHKQNPAVIRAALLAHSWARGQNIADNFYFKTDFESIGKWYRQLMGESIGKEWNKPHTKQLWIGITPTVSVGSTDLHSMAQLYFGGPRDKLFTIVKIGKWKHEQKVPVLRQYDQLVNHVQGKRLSTIMDAIVGGVEATLRKGERPYCLIELPDAGEWSVGALLQLHMMEMMYLAALLDVNAFDQPNVESYKIETKRILARK